LSTDTGKKRRSFSPRRKGGKGEKKSWRPRAQLIARKGEKKKKKGGGKKEGPFSAILHVVETTRGGKGRKVKKNRTAGSNGHFGEKKKKRGEETAH